MATLKDIARRSGVSTATVSYVVNNGPRSVLPATRERVLEAIADLNYHPNAHARGLRGKKTNTIGVVFPHIVEAPFENVYFGPVLAGIIDIATQRKKATMLFTAFDWDEAERSAPQLCDGRCDGFLVVAPLRETRLVGDLLAREVPAVVIGTHPALARVDTVDADNIQGGRLAANYLASLGHRRIGIVLDEALRTSTAERLEGFRIGLRECGLPTDDRLVIQRPADGKPRSLVEFRTWLRDPVSRPTAIFCVQDDSACRAVDYATDIGLRVPEDLSIVGFDDIACAASCSPPLTTIRQPMRQIGFRAAELLCERIDAFRTEPHDFLLDVQLIERCSTAPPPEL
jgi:LacI family transcriptional regulator